MDFNQKRAKESAIDTGAAVVGAVAGLAVSNKVTALIAEKSPNSTMTRHVPAALLVGIIAAQAFDIVPDSPLVDSALQGIAVVTGMQAVREYSGANTPAGLSATSGIAALVNQYVPALQAEGSAPTTTAAAVALQGLGLVPYNEPVDFRNPAYALAAAGRSQQTPPVMRPRDLGMVPSGAQPKVLG